MQGSAAATESVSQLSVDLSAVGTQAKAQAHALGFDLAGIAVLGPMESAPILDEWLAAGMHGEMDYLARGAGKRRDSRLPFPGALSAIVVGMDYGGRQPPGPVARYARGDDYHDVMVDRLRQLHRWLEERVGSPVPGKAYVDTAPILERELARRAGLGWIGKSTMLINPRIGSYFFIGALFVALPLSADEPFTADHCGTCTRCLDACPTDAFVEPRKLDARKCISYLTIEARGEIPERFREAIGDRIYGCDVCQEVCPWNVRFARSLPDGSPYEARAAIAGRDAAALAHDLLATDDDAFRADYRRSPMKRAKLAGLRRNAAVVLENLTRRTVTRR